MPRVSVVMAVYNGERFLREAVDSILRQTFRDFELMIIDDGSSDRTAQILDTYSDPRLVLVRNVKNLGLTASLNKGLKLAKGDYLARQDADDVSLPQRLAKQVQFLDHRPEIDIVGTDFFEIDGHRREQLVRMPSHDLAIKWHALFQNPFVHSTVMFRTERICQAGCYSVSPGAWLIEDYDLWSRLIHMRCLTANLPEALVRRRRNPIGVSASNAEVQSRNFRNLVRRNLRRWGIGNLLESRRCDLVWSLEVGGGSEASADEVTAALEDLEQLLERFGEYFELGASDRKRVRQIAMHRASHTLLHGAAGRTYEMRFEEALAFASLAWHLDPRLILGWQYWRVRLKTILGTAIMARLREIRKTFHGIF